MLIKIFEVYNWWSIWASPWDFSTISSTCGFQQCGNLASVDSEESVQPPYNPRKSKWCSVSSLKLIEYSSDKQRLWPDCAYEHADLMFCWSHIPHCWKSHVAAHIKCQTLNMLSSGAFIEVLNFRLSLYQPPFRTSASCKISGDTVYLYRLVWAIAASIYEPRHEISNNVVCATSKASDQPAAYTQSDRSLC